MSDTLTPERLASIESRVDRNSYPEGDRAVLLAEVKRLREEVAAALATSRVMQAEQRASVTLAYVQGSLDEAINPTAPIGDEDEDAAPCCYGYITSRGSDHEPDCPESARREG